MTSGTYRKRPVEVRAWKVPTSREADSLEFYPEWVAKAFEDKKLAYGHSGVLVVFTLEGAYKLSLAEQEQGYWIIQGVKGEIYPCEGEIFELTYEEVK